MAIYQEQFLFLNREVWVNYNLRLFASNFPQEVDNLGPVVSGLCNLSFIFHQVPPHPFLMKDYALPEVSQWENGQTELEGWNSAGVYPDPPNWVRLGTEHDNNSSSSHSTGLHLRQTDQLADDPRCEARLHLHLDPQLVRQLA